MTKAAKLTGLSSIILLLLLLSTDPQGLPSVVLVAPFILLFIAVSAAVSHALNTYGLFKQKRLRIGLVSAAIPVLLLVLQSLGQLTLRDTLAIFALFGVAYFYISRLGVRTVG